MLSGVGHFDEFEYRVEMADGTGHWVARGLQVGRLAVRACDPTEKHYCPNGTVDDAAGQWTVDHWPSSISVSTFRALADAVRFADELSWRARTDLDAETLEGLAAQLGPELVAWCDAVQARGYHPLPGRPRREAGP